MTVDYSELERQASFPESNENQAADTLGERESARTQDNHCLDDEDLRCRRAEGQLPHDSESDVIEGYFDAQLFENHQGSEGAPSDSVSGNPPYAHDNQELDGISHPRHFRLDSIPPESYGPDSLPSLAARPVLDADSAVKSGVVLNALALTIMMGFVVWWAVQYYDRLQERAILAQMGEQMSLNAQMIRELQLRDGHSSSEATRANEPESRQIRTHVADLKVSNPHKGVATLAPKRSFGKKRDNRNRTVALHRPRSLPASEKKPQLEPAENLGDRASEIAETKRTVPQSGASAGEGEIEVPTKEQVKAAMAAIAPEIKKCGQGREGRIRLRMAVSGSTGRVIKAGVMDADVAGTPIATCVTKTIRAARFPLFSRRLLVIKYPFDI